MKLLNLLLLTLLATSVVIAVEKESVAPARSLMSFATRMTLVALKEGNGVISTETLRDHATALMKHLEGEPNSDEILIVHIERDPERAMEEVVIYVGYDNGATSRGYFFTFRKKMGFLKSIALDHGE